MATITNVPSFVRSAAADPKCATESALLSTVNFYSDAVEPEALDLVTEELVRRGGDPDYLGVMEVSANLWD